MGGKIKDGGLHQYMALRDHFASCALQGLLSGRCFPASGPKDVLPRWAYEYADAMLKAREHKEQRQ